MAKIWNTGFKPLRVWGRNDRFLFSPVSQEPDGDGGWIEVWEDEDRRILNTQVGATATTRLTLENLANHTIRLYEQQASGKRCSDYVKRRLQWLTAGFADHPSVTPRLLGFSEEVSLAFAGRVSITRKTNQRIQSKQQRKNHGKQARTEN